MKMKIKTMNEETHTMKNNMMTMKIKTMRSRMDQNDRFIGKNQA